MDRYQSILVFFGAVSTVSVILGFFILIFRQGRFFGRLIEHQEAQDAKINKNCKGLERISASFVQFKTDFDTGRYMTIPIHADICTEKREPIHKRLDEGSQEFRTIRATLKEDRELIHETKQLLVSVNTMLPVIQEQLRSLQTRA